MIPGQAISAVDCERYLRLLGVARRASSPEALAELNMAHLTRVPFENLSKLYHNRRSGLREIPDLLAFLDGIEQYNLGGTCYANNWHFHCLLRALGYKVDLCGADMSCPDVHIANIVRLEGREYLVDVGYAAPFFAPLPRDLDENYEILLGDDRYVLKPRDPEGKSRLELHRRGRQPHGYVLKPAPRRIEEFAPAIAESFSSSATFMNALLIVRFAAGRSLVLNNLALIECEGTATSLQRIPDPALLPDLIERHFGIPCAIALEVLSGLSMTRDPWAS